MEYSPLMMWVVKYVSAEVSAFQIVFFSSLLSFPLLTLMMVRDATPGTLRPNRPGWIALRSLAMAIIPACAFYAFSVLPLAQTYALLFATPFLITILSIPLLGEKVGLPRMAAVIAGFIGVLVVLRPGETELGLGHAAALLAAFGNAFQSVILRKLRHVERRVVLMLFPILTTVVVMGVAPSIRLCAAHRRADGGIGDHIRLRVLCHLAAGLFILARGVGRSRPDAIFTDDLGYPVWCFLVPRECGSAHNPWCGYHHRKRRLHCPQRSSGRTLFHDSCP